MVGDRDRAEADVAGGREQHVDRGRAVVGVVGVHVQIDLDQLVARDPRADLGLRVRGRGAARPGARRSPRPGRRPCSTRAPPGPRRRARRGSSRRRRRGQPLELGGEHVDVADLEERAEVAVAQHLLVDRHARGERHGAGAERAHEHAGRGDLAERGGDDDVGAGRTRASSSSTICTRWRRLERSVGTRAGLGVDDRLPRELLRQQPQRAQEQPQRAALLAVGERDPHRRAVGLRDPRLGGHAGPQQLVGGGEEALQQLGGGLVARGAGVHAAEEQLDELARDLGAQHPLGGRVEGADVERAAVPQRDAARARRPRLVHVDEVQRRDGEHLLDRARDVDRRRGRDPLAAAGEQQLADAQHAHPAVGVEQDVRLLARGADQLARLAHELRLARRREQQHAVTALGELARDLSGERPHLVRILERMRRDLGDGETLCHFAAA